MNQPTGTSEYDEILHHLREACLGLPSATEKLSHGAPSFFINDKKCFAMFVGKHHKDQRLSLWCAAPPGVQSEMIDEAPDQFFSPPYVGGRGWLGVRLDQDPDWDEIANILLDAYRCIAPKKLLNLLD